MITRLPQCCELICDQDASAQVEEQPMFVALAISVAPLQLRAGIPFVVRSPVVCLPEGKGKRSIGRGPMISSQGAWNALLSRIERVYRCFQPLGLMNIDENVKADWSSTCPCVCAN